MKIGQRTCGRFNFHLNATFHPLLCQIPNHDCTTLFSKLEEWWLQYAYLQCRESLSFSTNFGGSWIPVGNPLHKIVQKHATKENLRSKSISCLMHQLFRYWALLRKQKPAPFKDGQGKNYAMEQVKYYFNR